MREVAIADGDTAACGQQAVNGGEQAAEQAAGGSRLIEAILDIWVPFLEAEQLRFVIWGQIMYTRYQRQRTCLHGSIQWFALQHRSGSGTTDHEKAAGNRRPWHFVG